VTNKSDKKNYYYLAFSNIFHITESDKIKHSYRGMESGCPIFSELAPLSKTTTLVFCILHRKFYLERKCVSW